MTTKTKKCVRCLKELPIDRFYPRKGRKLLKTGEFKVYAFRNAYCSKCTNKIRKARRLKQMREAHEKINDIDRAMSTEEGFDNLLKEYGL